MKSSALRFSFISILVLFAACDKVKNPIVKKQEVPPVDTAGNHTPVVKVRNSNSSVAGFKKFLLEDYTGQTCPNCPTAARTIKNTLMPRYGDTMVVVAVHQGNTFAKPTTTYTNDFRSTAGEIWGGTAGYNIPYWPCGLINRATYGSSTTNPQTSWTSVIPTAKKDPFIVQLGVATDYDTVSRILNVEVKSKFRTAYTNDVKIIAIYEQDGIVGRQKDGSLDVEDYEFEHMMRGTINDTWGTTLKSGPIAAQDSLTVNFNGFILPKSAGLTEAGKTAVTARHVFVVVFAYDASTRVVLQAEKVKLFP